MLGGQECDGGAPSELEKLALQAGVASSCDVYCSAMALHAAAQVTWRSRQKGVVRYNCADSLDRTNAASYFAAVQVWTFMLSAFALWCSFRSVMNSGPQRH